MLDFRHETFLTLCKIKSYTKTAEALHITQPAVTQHIHFLEEYYGHKLISYEGRTLTLTKHGQMLHDFATTMSADTKKVKDMLKNDDQQERSVIFGATLSIGEYVMPDILSALMKRYPQLHITMFVENTEVLLEKLQDGKIHFALLEGFFDRSQYSSKLFSKEKFIPICSTQSELANQVLSLPEILNKRLILREKGSGTRDIFEQILYENNLTINSFQNIIEVGNMHAIKQLVAEDLGITFLYQVAALKEMREHQVCELKLKNFSVMHEFNFVYLKNSMHENEYLEWYELMKKAI